jgi:predicted phage tail protein
MGKPKVTNNYNISTTGGIISYSVSFKIEYRVYGDLSWIDHGTFTVTNNVRQNFRRIFRIPSLAPNRYEIRVTRLTAADTSKQVSDLNWTAVDEIRNENIAYVNSALLAIHMLANNQISGTVPNISCIVTGKQVRVYS